MDAPFRLLVDNDVARGVSSNQALLLASCGDLRPPCGSARADPRHICRRRASCIDDVIDASDASHTLNDSSLTT